jgi:hypothetical protein
MHAAPRKISLAGVRAHGNTAAVGRTFACAALIVASLTGCTSSSDGASVDATLQPKGSKSAPVLAQASDRPAPDAPSWCGHLLGENVLTLPAALTVMDDPTRQATAKTILRGAADDLRDAADGLPANVADATRRVIEGLQRVADDPTSTDALTVLADSLGAMEYATQPECGFTS